MKKIIALILVGMLCLAGCQQQQPPAEASTGTTQTSGNLTVFVPNGWTLVPDETNADQAYLCKGGSDLNTTPYIKLTLGSALPSEALCTHVQTLEPQTYGQLTWNGFSGIRSDHRVIYLVTKTDSGSILATLWYNDDQMSLEGEAVQAILASVSGTATNQPEPAPEIPEAAPTSVIGDWAGQLELYDCSGDFGNQNGTAYTCIARFQEAESGSMAVYIGLPADCAPFTNLTVFPGGEEVPTTLSGTWQGASFEQIVLELNQNTLRTGFAITTENGNASVKLVLTPTTDFEAKAAQLGYTDFN